MSEHPRNAQTVLIDLLRKKNTTYNAAMEAARLDAAIALVDFGFASYSAKPDEDLEESEDNKITDEQKLWGEVVATVREIMRSPNTLPKDAVRAARQLLTWGVS